jgi:hypothetical protein
MAVLSWERYSETMYSLEQISFDDFMALYNWMEAVTDAEDRERKRRERK